MANNIVQLNSRNGRRQPRQRKPKVQRTKARKPRVRTAPTRPRRKKARLSTASAGLASTYGAMISNPFTAPLRVGMFGEQATGIMRFKRSYSFGVGTNGTPSLADTCGFILWCPITNSLGYITSSSYDQGGSLIMFKAASAATAMINTAGNSLGATTYAAFGAASLSGTTTSVTTPDNPYLNFTAAKTRLVSSGLVLRCMCNPLKLSGEYIKLESVPTDLLLENGVDDGVSVDNLFEMSSHTPQPFMAGKAVRHIYLNDRHNVGQHVDCHDEYLVGPDGSDGRHSPFSITLDPAKASVETEWSSVNQPKFYGFAFRGVDPEMLSSIFVDAYVTKEYTVRPFQGLPNPTSARLGPNFAEPAHLFATASKGALDALDNGIGALSKGLVTKGFKYIASDVLGMAAAAA